MSNEILSQLIELSHWLGEPSRELAILGEGNTSAKLPDGTFFVKASGSSLATMRAEQFVQVRPAGLLEMVRSEETFSDAQVEAALEEARLEKNAPLPSTETFFHGMLLELEGVRFVGHTHPISINGILCSRDGWNMVRRGRMFPDEIVVCGIAPCHVPYTDPGLPLCREIDRRIAQYQEEYGGRPKAVLLQNHGLIALGGTAAEVQAIHGMWDKTARILTATMAFSGPNVLTPEQADHIYTWPAEHYRQRALGLTADDGTHPRHPQGGYPAPQGGEGQ